MAVTIASTSSEGLWRLEDCSETIEFRNKAGTSTDPVREYRFHLSIVVNKKYNVVTGWNASGTLTEQVNANIATIAADLLCAGGVTMVSAGGLFSASTYAKIVLVSDSFTPEGEFSNVMRRTQEWDTVSNWADYPNE